MDWAGESGSQGWSLRKSRSRVPRQIRGCVATLFIAQSNGFRSAKAPSFDSISVFSKTFPCGKRFAARPNDTHCTVGSQS